LRIFRTDVFLPALVGKFSMTSFKLAAGMSLALSLGLAAALSASDASASTLASYTPASPSDLDLGNWLDVATGSNELVQFSVGGPSTITGFDLYAGSPFGLLGQSVMLKLANDNTGTPNAGSIQEFLSTIDSITPYGNGVNILHASFSPITIGAGTYWTGLSGATQSLVWASYFGDNVQNPPGQYFLNNNTLLGTPTVYHLAYSIEGSTSPAPEPAVWAMMISGLGLAGAGLRSRRRMQPA
jgi:hypothetical protein